MAARVWIDVVHDPHGKRNTDVHNRKHHDQRQHHEQRGKSAHHRSTADELDQPEPNLRDLHLRRSGYLAADRLELRSRRTPSNCQLFIFNFLPVGGKLFADWAVAGLSPSLHGLAAGQLPAGAIVGRNGRGQTRYSLCPAKGANTRFAFLLYALPQRVAAKPGFDANALREQALHTAEHAGLLAFSYRRH